MNILTSGLINSHGGMLEQGRSQELEMGGAKLLGEGSGGRLRPKGGCTCTLGTPLTTALPINI